MNREVLEFIGRSNAGIKKVVDEHNLITVLGDIEMFTMPGDESVSTHLETQGFWESWISSWVVNNIGDTFVDVGANTGYYSFLAGRLGADVMAIEANPRFAELIDKSSRHNEIPILLRNCAVSDTEGTVVLSVPDHLHGSASIMVDFVGSQYGGNNIEVSSHTLDSLVGDLDITTKSIIKIDAEGSEEKIWAGMQKVLEKQPIVILEWTPGAYSLDFLKQLKEYAPLTWINHLGEEESVDELWVYAQRDWVMLALRPGER